MRRQQARWKATKETYEKYTKPMLKMTQGTEYERLLTRDDKHKRCVWGLAPKAYGSLLVAYVANNASWNILPCDTEVAKRTTFESLQILLTEKQLKEYGITAEADLIPYLYITVKSKCYQYDGTKIRRTCMRPNHSRAAGK